jgi:hypothetical protein
VNDPQVLETVTETTPEVQVGPKSIVALPFDEVAIVASPVIDQL